MAASQETQVRSSEAFDAHLDNTQAEAATTSLQSDLNYIRTVHRLIIDPAGNWFDTPVTSLSALHALTSSLDTDLSTHLGDASIHFTEASIDHDNLLNVGVNDHSQIDAHITDLANPHVVTTALIGAADLVHSHVSSDVSDFAVAVAAQIAVDATVAANTAKVSAAGSIDSHSDVVTTGPGTPSQGDVLYWDGACWTSTTPGSGGAVPRGDVSGPSPGSSTDNALARWDTASGKLLQNSDVLLGDHVGGVATLKGGNGITLALQSDTSYPLLLNHSDGVAALEVGAVNLTLKPAASLYLEPQAGSIYIQAGPGDQTLVRHADGSLALEVTPTAGGSLVLHDLLRPNASAAQDVGSSAFPFKKVVQTEFVVRDVAAGGESDLVYSHGGFISANALVDPTPVPSGYGAGYGNTGLGTFTQPVGNLVGFNVGGKQLFVGDSPTFTGGFISYGITHPGHIEVDQSLAPSLSFLGPFELGALTPGGRWGNVLAEKLTLEEGLPAPTATPGMTQFYMSSANAVTVIKGNGTIVNLELGGGGGSGLKFASQQFIPTLGQVAFTLSQAPVGRTLMFVNGSELFENDAFTVASTALTFLPAVAGYGLEPTDIVDVYYEV